MFGGLELPVACGHVLRQRLALFMRDPEQGLSQSPLVVVGGTVAVQVVKMMRSRYWGLPKAHSEMISTCHWSSQSKPFRTLSTWRWVSTSVLRPQSPDGAPPLMVTRPALPRGRIAEVTALVFVVVALIPWRLTAPASPILPPGAGVPPRPVVVLAPRFLSRSNSPPRRCRSTCRLGSPRRRRASHLGCHRRPASSRTERTAEHRTPEVF